MESLANSTQRMVYLITYGRVDTTKFSSKESFSSAILEAWQHFGIRILHWVVCIKAHINNNGCGSGDNINMNLYHFHMAVKLAKRGRWLQVRNFLDEKYGIQVNFSDNHSSYYTAYRYVTKEDHEGEFRQLRILQQTPSTNKTQKYQKTHSVIYTDYRFSRKLTAKFLVCNIVKPRFSSKLTAKFLICNIVKLRFSSKLTAKFLVCNIVKPRFSRKLTAKFLVCNIVKPRFSRKLMTKHSETPI